MKEELDKLGNNFSLLLSCVKDKNIEAFCSCNNTASTMYFSKSTRNVPLSW